MKRSLFGAVALAAVAVTSVLIGTASAAKPTPPAPTGNCPASGITNYPVASNVSASSTVNGQNVTYFFTATSNGNQNTGLPGLVGLCAYTDGIATGATAKKTDWKAGFNTGNVSFVRSGGTKTNIVYSTAAQEVGTATFGTLPNVKNDILLHIANSAACAGQPTCYVQPNPTPCTFGDTSAGYNALPTGVESCSPPSLGFEATGTNEFGDLVTLSSAGSVKSMTVDFQSYGCETSGHWNTANCVSPVSPGTFTVPGGITASIYDPNGAGGLITPIATKTIHPDIPYRPTSVLDSACPNNPPADAANSRFLNGAGQCVYSRSVPLTFTFAGENLPQTVVWTVQFDTSHSGYEKIGEGPCNLTDRGCGYDSLNVGAKSYVGAPYVGADPSEGMAYRSFYAPNYQLPITPLGADSGWTGFRPLGQIILN